MIKVIYGAKGSGKTKRILEEANDACETNGGITVFITDSDKYIYNIRRGIRFINSNDFDVSSGLGLLGFIRGLIAGNSDINLIFIDGITRIANTEADGLKDFFEKLERYSESLEVKVVLTLSTDTPPDFVKDYII